MGCSGGGDGEGGEGDVGEGDGGGVDGVGGGEVAREDVGEVGAVVGVHVGDGVEFGGGGDGGGGVGHVWGFGGGVGRSVSEVREVAERKLDLVGW